MTPTLGSWFHLMLSEKGLLSVHFKQFQHLQILNQRNPGGTASTWTARCPSLRAATFAPLSINLRHDFQFCLLAANPRVLCRCISLNSWREMLAQRMIICKNLQLLVSLFGWSRIIQNLVHGSCWLPWFYQATEALAAKAEHVKNTFIHSAATPLAAQHSLVIQSVCLQQPVD